MKLLLAVDHSPMSRAVVDQATKRPWPKGATAFLLHVIETLPLRDGVMFLKEMREAAAAWLSPAAELLHKAGIPTTVEIIEGIPRIAVSDFAEQWGADFLMIGAHSSSGLARFLLGGVAQATLRSAPCSVEVVRAKPADATVPRKVLLATDGSEYSMAAARSVARRPWPAGTQVQIISVAQVMPVIAGAAPLVPSYYPSPELIETVQAEFRRRAVEAVERTRQVLSISDAKLLGNESLPVGDAREVILDQAAEWNADLIVLGSHGWHGFARFMLGSVSEAVAMHAHCSVEVIRETHSASKESS